MISKKRHNNCRNVRERLQKMICSHFTIEADWIQNHIANCPRCQQRMLPLGRVEIALTLLKTQPHQLDLLMQANTQALGILKHSLRNAPKAARLKTMRPEPRFGERCAKYVRPSMNAAACVAILILAKIGIFESMNRFETESGKAVHQYYAKHLGNELTDEIFAERKT